MRALMRWYLIEGEQCTSLDLPDNALPPSATYVIVPLRWHRPIEDAQLVIAMGTVAAATSTLEVACA